MILSNLFYACPIDLVACLSSIDYKENEEETCIEVGKLKHLLAAENIFANSIASGWQVRRG